MLGSANYTSQRKVQRCFHFDRGHCRRGQSCKFIHTIVERSFAETENVSLNCPSPPPIELQLSDSTARNVAPSVKVCRYFSKKGKCPFGDNCLYLHLCSSVHCGKPTVSQLSTVDNFVTANQDVVPKISTDGAAAIAKNKVCTFYRAGYCRKGQKCQFQHAERGSKRCGWGQQSINYKSKLNSSSLALKSKNKLPEYDVPEEAVSFSQVELDNSAVHLEKASATISLGDDVSKQDGNDSVKELCVSIEEKLCKMRETEIQQLYRRYPKAQKIQRDEQSAFQFVFEPTDPDWPYDVKLMNMEVSFPEKYPAQMMTVQVMDSERIPATVQRSLTESILDWISMRFNTSKINGHWELLFRPMMLWLDKNAEDLMTEALKEYKRELMAKAAGMQFIPATKLRQLYPDAVGRNSQNKTEAADNQQESSTGDSVMGENAEVDIQKPAFETDSSGTVCTSVATVELKDDEKENCLSKNIVSTSNRRGTEVSLCGLQLTDGAATLIASQITLVMTCTRCTNNIDVRLVPGLAYRAECSRCHGNLLIEFSNTIAHQMSSVIGWLNLEGCCAFDLVLADCQFAIGCINCSKEEKVDSVSPGHSNCTWCRHCHQKLTVFTDNVRFVHRSTSVQIDASKAIPLDIRKRVKNVHDPAIQEGQPLPNNGTCKHYKKSFRWLRFPCCGKAFPCDKCHNEKEGDHEMKLANRMICGFCAKEQTYATERPCVSCSSVMINKSTSHWEGGKGCRDQIKMSRSDTKKYANSSKTIPSSTVGATKKITKLRHV